MDRLISLKVAAERLGCSLAMLRKWAYQGRIEVVKIGRLVRIRESIVERLMLKGSLPHDVNSSHP